MLAKRKLYVISGSITVALIVANVIMNVVTDNKIIAAQNDGNSEGQTQGYADGHSEGNTVGYNEGNTVGYNEGNTDGYNEGNTDGYNEGNDEGYIEGDTEGFETGLTTGYEEGEIIGFAAGEKDGYQGGWGSAYQPGKTQGYYSGYTASYTEVINGDFLVYDVTYVRIMKILDKSDATSVVQLNNEFEDAGIRSGYVWAKLAEGGGLGYPFIAFDTIDEGIIIVDAWSHQVVHPEVGDNIFELFSIPPRDYDDTIVSITISW